MSFDALETLEQEQVTPTHYHASNVLDATAAILAALNCPPKIRPMMSALFALTAGRTRTITFTRADVARRLYNGPNALPADELARACQRVTDDLGRMLDWVQVEGLDAIIKYDAGTKDAPGRIQTRLMGWVADVAAGADESLSPDADDRERRTYFRKAASILIGRRLRRSPVGGGRPKKQAHPGTFLRLGLAFIDKWWDEKSASFGLSDEELKTFLFSEIERHRKALCTEKASKETAKASGIDKGKFGTQLREKSCSENSGQEGDRVPGGGSGIGVFDGEGVGSSAPIGANEDVGSSVPIGTNEDVGSSVQICTKDAEPYPTPRGREEKPMQNPANC